MIRDAFEHLPIIAGNVAMEWSFLPDRMRCQCIKIGQGPGVSTTRVVAGQGVQMMALYTRHEPLQLGITILADGGITKSGDIVKALTWLTPSLCKYGRL